MYPITILLKYFQSNGGIILPEIQPHASVKVTGGKINMVYTGKIGLSFFLRSYGMTSSDSNAMYNMVYFSNS